MINKPFDHFFVVINHFFYKICVCHTSTCTVTVRFISKKKTHEKSLVVWQISISVDLIGCENSSLVFTLMQCLFLLFEIFVGMQIIVGRDRALGIEAGRTGLLKE